VLYVNGVQALTTERSVDPDVTQRTRPIDAGVRPTSHIDITSEAVKTSGRSRV
jgi:hypothetical protein